MSGDKRRSRMGVRRIWRERGEGIRGRGKRRGGEGEWGGEEGDKRRRGEDGGGSGGGGGRIGEGEGG